ncbi:hypothetical protein ACKVMT_11625 [Halobacteriales archaeon Cl-PHB]
MTPQQNPRLPLKRLVAVLLLGLVAAFGAGFGAEVLFGDGPDEPTAPLGSTPVDTATPTPTATPPPTPEEPPAPPETETPTPPPGPAETPDRTVRTTDSGTDAWSRIGGDGNGTVAGENADPTTD